MASYDLLIRRIHFGRLYQNFLIILKLSGFAIVSKDTVIILIIKTVSWEAMFEVLTSKSFCMGNKPVKINNGKVI